MAKRLYRSETNKKIAGVCGGIADYFDIDPVLVRLPWILSVLCAGVGLVAYIVAAFIIPTKSEA